ncbi:hypothetical protein [Spiroplasma poulsonii]
MRIIIENIFAILKKFKIITQKNIVIEEKDLV